MASVERQCDPISSHSVLGSWETEGVAWFPWNAPGSVFWIRMVKCMPANRAIPNSWQNRPLPKPRIVPSISARAGSCHQVAAGCQWLWNPDLAGELAVGWRRSLPLWSHSLCNDSSPHLVWLVWGSSHFIMVRFYSQSENAI